MAIVALATPPGIGAIHIIRISGSDAFALINQISLNPVKKTQDLVEINYLINRNKKIIDKVVLVKYYQPNSYTGEDLIEINCHGNNLIVKLIIDELIFCGAIPAKPGEFTKIALLNNKITLNEVENIDYLFKSKSAADIFNSSEELMGKNSQIIQQISNNLFNLIAEVEINIDYPPERSIDDQPIIDKIQREIKNNISQLHTLHKNSCATKPSNFRVLFIGKPNAGKSSLINFLIQQDKIIVSNTPGTTRDVIEVEYFYKNYLLTLVDSAGIRITDDHLEIESIKRTKQEIQKSNLIIYLIDGCHPEENDVFNSLLKNKAFFTVYTKGDLTSNKNLNNLISTKNSDVEALYKVLDNYLQDNYLPSGIKSEYIIGNIFKAFQSMEKCLKNNISIDLIAEDLITARQYLLDSLQINETNMERINKIFDNFCIGK